MLSRVKRKRKRGRRSGRCVLHWAKIRDCYAAIAGRRSLNLYVGFRLQLRRVLERSRRTKRLGQFYYTHALDVYLHARGKSVRRKCPGSLCFDITPYYYFIIFFSLFSLSSQDVLNSDLTVSERREVRIVRHSRSDFNTMVPTLSNREICTRLLISQQPLLIASSHEYNEDYPTSLIAGIVTLSRSGR